jgi:hypothetical protein
MTSLVDSFFDNPAFQNAIGAWQAFAQRSLLTYNEPILPGWTINIDSNNSRSPETERDVLRMASYGKQLGRLSDAVEELIKLSGSPDHDAFEQFGTLKKKIDAVKKQALARRADQMASDLLLLKSTDVEEFERVKAAVLAALDATAVSAPAGSPGSRGSGSPSPARRARPSGATSRR